MVYVISDLHGYPLSSFKLLLNRADFNGEDELYILGDVIDRNGDGGVEMLQWIIGQDNVHMLMGNHEAMLLSCEFILDEVTEENINTITSADNMELLNNYMLNGGDVTLAALKNIPRRQQRKIFEFLRNCPLYEEIAVDEKRYLLVHAGLENFSPERSPSDYTAEELLWAWPELTDKYYGDIVTVFGHTPSMSYGETFRGKIIKTDTWIDIDVGAAYGEEPVLLRLNDMKEFKLDG